MDNFIDEFDVPDEAVSKPILAHRFSDNWLLSDKGNVKYDDLEFFSSPVNKDRNLKIKRNKLVTFGSSGNGDSSSKSEINCQKHEVNAKQALVNNIKSKSNGELTHRIKMKKFRFFLPRQPSTDIMAELLR